MFDGWFDSLLGSTAEAAPSFTTGGTNDIAQFLARDNGTANFGGLTSGFMGTDTSSMGDLFNTNAGIGSGLGDALGYGQAAAQSGGGAGDFLSTLASQVGDKLFNPKDPLSSIANLVGVAGAVRGMLGKEHSDLPNVQKLFDKAGNSPYKAANVITPRGPLSGRAPGSFISPTGAPAGGLTLIKKG